MFVFTPLMLYRDTIHYNIFVSISLPTSQIEAENFGLDFDWTILAHDLNHFFVVLVLCPAAL